MESIGQWTGMERATQKEKLQRHTNKHKHISNEKKNKPIETDPEMTQMIDLLDKDSKITDIITLHMIEKGEES